MRGALSLQQLSCYLDLYGCITMVNRCHLHCCGHLNWLEGMGDGMSAGYTWHLFWAWGCLYFQVGTRMARYHIRTRFFVWKLCVSVQSNVTPIKAKPSQRQTVDQLILIPTVAWRAINSKAITYIWKVGTDTAMYFGPQHALVKVRDRFFINSFRQSLHTSQAALNSRRLISTGDASNLDQCNLAC